MTVVHPDEVEAWSLREEHLDAFEWSFDWLTVERPPQILAMGWVVVAQG